MSNKVFVYGDLETVAVLNKEISKVILFGGYLGYNNFGDILQLKGVIKYHASITTLEPVVVCQMGAIPDKDFLSRLRKWFGVRAFIFVQDWPVDATLTNLHLIDKALPIEYLHVYGGGFLNRMWGESCLRLIEGLIENFRVNNYIISGQQIDAEFANRLSAHLEKYRPKLIGTRDFESQTVIKSLGFHCDFSFDDASNIIEAWSHRKPQNRNSKPKEALFIHLNTSNYALNTSEGNKRELNRITQILKNLAKRFSAFEPVFLSGYSEYRIHVRDTLATIISMEDALPFLDYRVMDIAHMALLHNPSIADIDTNLGIFSGGIAISSSYHTALFCNMLNIPCYLMSENDYYRQKRYGLGEKRTLDAFLEKPSVLSYSSSMEHRRDWLQKLSSFFENSDRNPVRSTISFNYNKNDYSPAQFQFKDVNRFETENEKLRKELERLEKELDRTQAEIKALRTTLC